ncbi:phosphatidylinositol kinase [Bacteroidia bacterium]|nr:phosphatidylinositol kinase [Bacteroidia bacterium]
MRSANVSVNGRVAGKLTKDDAGKYLFRYDDTYFFDTKTSSVALTLPKTQQEFQSETLFPFFFNMLSEGANKQIQLQQYKIDENDYFGLLLATAGYDTIGAVTVEEIKTQHDD